MVIMIIKYFGFGVIILPTIIIMHLGFGIINLHLFIRESHEICIANAFLNDGDALVRRPEDAVGICSQGRM